MFKKVSLALFGAMLMLSGNAMAAKKPSADGMSIVDIVVNSPDHTVLEELVISTGVVDLLSSNGRFTVFAPTDQAFEDLGPVDLSECQLINVLAYHVTNGKRWSNSVVNAKNPKWLRMWNGEFITATPDGMLIDTSSINDALPMAAITGPDNAATNGVVHVIDQVLVPESVLDDC